MKNIKLLLNVKKAKSSKVHMVLISPKWFHSQELNLNEIQAEVDNVLGYETEVIITDKIGGKLKPAEVKII